MTLVALIVAGIVVFCLAVVMVLALCAMAALVCGLDENELPEPTVIDAIDTFDDLADVVEFDFPREQPRLVLIVGGRDVGKGAA